MLLLVDRKDFFSSELIRSIHFLSLLNISFRYRVLCLLLTRSPLRDQLHDFLYKIAYVAGYHNVLNFRWHREHGNENSHCFRPNFHFAPSSTVLQNIKCYFFKFGYILWYKLSKMQIFCLNNWRHFFCKEKRPTSFMMN